jgi:hypothetical protein
MSTPTPVSPATNLTMVVGTVIAAVPMMCVVAWFVLASDGVGDYPDTWVPLAVGAAAVAAYAFCELVGFRAAPLTPQDDQASVARTSFQRFTASTFVRFAVCEVVFLIGFALGFAVQSFWPVLVGAAFALPLLLWEAWPGARNRGRFADSLERNGISSGLR